MRPRACQRVGPADTRRTCPERPRGRSVRPGPAITTKGSNPLGYIEIDSMRMVFTPPRVMTLPVTVTVCSACPRRF